MRVLNRLLFLALALLFGLPIPARATTYLPFTITVAPGQSLLLYTDVADGPITGGENNKGTYQSLFGVNIVPSGLFSDLGTKTIIKVCGQPVDNYRYLTLSKPSAAAATAGISTAAFTPVQQVVYQLGALGSPTLGTPCKIDVVTSGVSTPANPTNGSSQFLDLDGNAITFTPNPGPMVFVSLSGNDANAGTIASPLRHLQTYAGTGNFGGALFSCGSYGCATTSNIAVPGTHIILRGGAWGGDFINNSVNVNFENVWAQFWSMTGIPPTGSANSGSIIITCYPGAAGANSPESCAWAGAGGSAGQAGLFGTDGHNSAAANPWGSTGFGRYFTISNLTITSPPNGVTDGAPINLQNQGVGWRVVNNELVWKMTNSPAQAAGIANSGVGAVRFGNYIHDIFGDSGEENHGIYVGAGGGNNEQNGIIAYNFIYNVTDGSCIQFHSGNGDGGNFYTGESAHHNWLQNCEKFGINLNTSWRSGTIYDNVMVDVAQIPMYMGTADVNAALGTKWQGNTAIGWATGAGTNGYSCMWNNGLLTGSGSVLWENNICYQRASHSANGYTWTNDGGAPMVYTTNLYYDANGTLTGGSAPSQTACGTGTCGNVVSDPLFTNLATLNLVPGTGSPALAAGTTPPAITDTRDFAFQPWASTGKRAIGAYQ